jgi:two-component system, CitB family, sensor kinase
MNKTTLTLQTKIMIMSTIFSLIIILILGLYYYHNTSLILERKIGDNALSIAKTIAVMPEILEAFQIEDPAAVIQPIAERIRQEVGAEFIVIGNREGIRYSHPYPDRLGKQMVGGDNDAALIEGRSYISKAVGTLGPSLRGKAPIFWGTDVIGVVSVGFLMEDIDELKHTQIIQNLGVIIIVLLIGILGSYYLSWNIKRGLFGLEPNEISQLFIERETILESVKEAIIAVNREGIIRVINEKAKVLIKSEEPLIGKRIDEVITNTKILEVLETGEAQYDQEMLFGEEWVITNRIPMVNKNKVIGAVASFRRKTEIDLLLQEFSEHKIYTDTLRAQNHEFINKLYTISGLLQLKLYDDAIHFITSEMTKKDDMIEFLMNNVKNSTVTAFIIGKIIRAEEVKVKIHINPDTLLSDDININTDDLLTIYGNLIENSIDAAREQQEVYRKIEILLYDTEESIIFRVEDWGRGIPKDIRTQIFLDGFTTKGDSRNGGLGLALVNTLINKHLGTIEIIDPSHQGVVFVVTLPKKRFVGGINDAEDNDRGR